MYAKYRIILQTTRGGYAMAASNTVNGLAALVEDWLSNTSAGRAVYDDMVQNVVLTELDQDTGAYKISKTVPVTNLADVIRKARQLGAR